MIKRIIKIIFALMLMLNFQVIAHAQDNGEIVNAEEYYRQQYEASGASDLQKYLDDNSREYLEAIGCENAELDGILSLSVSSVFEALLQMLRANISAPLKGCLTACGAVMLVSICSGFFPDDEKTKGVLNLVCGSFVIISVFVPAAETVRAGASAMKLCAAFEKTLIPVLAAVMTASGSPTAAFSYQGAAFAAAQATEALAENFAVPLVMITGTLGAIGAILPTLKLSAVSELIRKTSSTVIGSAAALFTGFIAIKNVVAGSADTLAAKGVKLAASTFIPVVGGALSEAYSALSGSVSLLKSAVGIFGILAILATCLPAIINLALWVLAMRGACMISDLLGNSQCSEILKNIAYMFSMLNSMLIFSASVLVISSGLVAAMKAGG